jgi:hypothetical protein
MGVGFMVPALISAIGSGAQYMNQRSANNRQQDAEVQAINDQAAIRNKATGAVGKLTQQVETDSPTQAASQATGDYVANLRKNAGVSALAQGGSTSSLAPSTVGSSRYNTDVANSSKQVQSYGNTNADEMGQIDAATRQRQNENLAMGTTATQLQGLNAQSNAQSFVDQLKAGVAGQQNPWVSLFSGLLKSGANAYATNQRPPINTPFAPNIWANNPVGANA